MNYEVEERAKLEIRNVWVECGCFVMGAESVQQVIILITTHPEMMHIC